jgi:hypothetical protein
MPEDDEGGRFAIDSLRLLRQFPDVWDARSKTRGRMGSRREISDAVTLVLCV